MNCYFCNSPGQSPGGYCSQCFAYLCEAETTTVAPSGSTGIDAIDAATLAGMTIEPAPPVVKDMIPRGLSILAGRPKVGKSWIAYDLAVAVASGADWNGQPVDAGPVLFLAMEDTTSRLQRRLAAMTDKPPANLFLATTCDGLPALEAWIVAHKPRMVCIDTLQVWRKGKASSYSRDYAEGSQLKMLADKHGIALVVIHHTVKLKAASPLDSVSGSTGLTGAADAVLVLVADESGRGALWITGRDLPRTILPMTFTGSKWQLAVKHKAITGPQNAPVAPKPTPATQKARQGLETWESEWMAGLMPDGSAVWVRSLYIGDEAAHDALVAHGCNRMVKHNRMVKECDLHAKFARCGFKIHGRIG